MFLFKKHLDRRTFLRGMGATVALPLLDAMIPARALLAAMRPTQRLAFVYFPHGAVMSEWPGRILEPLSPFANRLTVVSGVGNQRAYGPVHAKTPGTWLSIGDATADQIAADYLGGDTPLRSLALAAEEPKKISAGIWEGQFDESLATTISFRGAGLPVAMESSPRAVFDALFACRGGPSGPPAATTSVLDLVSDAAASLRARLGPADRAALNDYLEAVRHAERRIEQLDAKPLVDREQAFVERLSLMFDLTALAFRADITRVASLMMAAEASSMTYGHLGVPESFHLISHHQNDPENLEKLVRIQAFHSGMFANFVRRLAESPDGDASLLDRSLILFGSNMSDSHAHDHFPLPLAVLGPRSSVLGHAQLPDRTPMSNVLLTVLRRAGVPSIAE